mmetsp:Transcript_21964/g.55977  ORF Transcript_21964/g.55977 Transcript_21964/m.55977 type:complete len:259 (-) Transcript_21964:3435-4211(-)
MPGSSLPGALRARFMSQGPQPLYLTACMRRHAHDAPGSQLSSSNHPARLIFGRRLSVAARRVAHRLQGTNLLRDILQAPLAAARAPHAADMLECRRALQGRVSPQRGEEDVVERRVQAPCELELGLLGAEVLHDGTPKGADQALVLAQLLTGLCGGGTTRECHRAEHICVRGERREAVGLRWQRDLHDDLVLVVQVSQAGDEVPTQQLLAARPVAVGGLGVHLNLQDRHELLRQRALGHLEVLVHCCLDALRVGGHDN